MPLSHVHDFLLFLEFFSTGYQGGSSISQRVLMRILGLFTWFSFSCFILVSFLSLLSGLMALG